MINRNLIRIKALQIVYSYYQNGRDDLSVAEKEFMFSLQKSYDLYHYLFLLMIEVTNLQKRNVDLRRYKFVPMPGDLAPDTRLIDNRFVRQLAENEALKQYAAAEGISWANDKEFVKQVLEMILDSDIYAAYVGSKEDDYETDRRFWLQAFKKLICDCEYVEEYLEGKSIYWNDDVAIVETFVLKTIRQFKEEEGGKQELLPMFKGNEDRVFATRLFRQTLLKGEEYRERISRHMKNWESERIANIDMLIMQMAVAEILTFPTIPTSVSLNEYIDMAKYYSTPKSSVFINGILDSIVGELKKEKLILKD